MADLPQVFDTIVTASRDDLRVLDPVGIERTAQDPTTRLAQRRASSSTHAGQMPFPAPDPLQALEAEPKIERMEVRLVHHGLPTGSGISDAATPYVFEVR